MQKAYEQLNASQLLAVKAINGPVLVLAGAGSGKTRVLTSRIAYMVHECGINPANILAITFTNKAAEQMRQRLDQYNCNSHLMHISTIHSMCALILRNYADKLGYNSHFSIYSETDKESAVKRILKKIGCDNEFVNDRAYSFIGNIKTFGLSISEAAEIYESLPSINTLIEIYKLYEEDLKKSNAMDFDDLLINTDRLLREFDDVCNYYNDNYKYISVDEFQDTNKVQYSIIMQLSKKHRNLFVIGDDDQSIYAWRGAEISNILDFHKQFPDVQTFKLEQNYRSTKKILNLANDIISHNPVRKEKKLWTDNDDGVKVEMYNAYSEMDEANYVVQQIASLVKYNNYQLKDFAVIMRINALTRSIEQECLKYGFASKVFGGFKFFERKEIKDILAYLRMLDNPNDNEAIFRIINVPRRSIGDTTISKLKQLSDQLGVSVASVITSKAYLPYFNNATVNKLTSFADLYDDLLMKSNSLSLMQFVAYLIDVIGYQQYLASDDKSSDKLENIAELMQSVSEYCSVNDQPTLSQYLQSVTLSSDIDTSGGEYITIATVHAVKGLEFKCVLVIGLEDGIFPTKRSINSGSELSEERRLMYVAVTRAKQRLYLTWARSRYLYNYREQCLPSRFLSEASLIKTAPKETQTQAIYNKYIQANAAPPVPIEISTGTHIIHKVFGEGVVLSVKGDNVDIVFSTVGIKTLSIRFAPITLK